MTEMKKISPLRKCIQSIPVLLICAVGAAATFGTVILVRHLHHAAFHEAGVGVSPSTLVKLWANDTFAKGTEIVAAVLMICLTAILSRALVRKFRWK